MTLETSFVRDKTLFLNLNDKQVLEDHPHEQQRRVQDQILTFYLDSNGFIVFYPLTKEDYKD